MREMTVKTFRPDFANVIDQVIADHEILKVSRAKGKDFVVISADDWKQFQETLEVLQNSSLMQQIAESLQTYMTGGGYKPTIEEFHAILGV